MRAKFTVHRYGKKAHISCLENEYDLLVKAIRDFDDRVCGVWAFVIRCMDLGVDLTNWWAQYADQKAAYFNAVGTTVFLHELTLNHDAFRAEKWRRYDLCRSLGIATCEQVQYPDLFETVESIRPERLDHVRLDFPANTFGQYVMACPPRNRFLDLEKLFVLDEVWGKHADFFKGAGMLKQGAHIPLEAVLPEAPNAVLRSVLKRHGVKAAALRMKNESLVYSAITNDETEQEKLRLQVIAPDLWCRMPPSELTWLQLQAFRWQSRAIGGAVVDLIS